MRIGIDFRILTLGRYLVRRGMGRFTQQQLRAVLGAGHEYVVLCEHDADLSLLDPEIARAPDVSVQRRPVPPPLAPGGWLEDNERYLDWVAGHDLDLYHSTTPFLCEEPVLAGFDGCPLVATWYDAIPLVHPDPYLADPCEKDCYIRGLGVVMGADRLLAISGASRDDAVRLLGRAPDSVDVAWPIPDGCFRPMAAAERDQALARLRGRLRLPERYGLSVTFPHFTKNLDRLLRGYARLAPDLRAQVPLVLVFDPGPAGRLGFTGHLAHLGIDGDVVVTGIVSDRELAALYGGATVVVHPSRHEGFGLPVVEAMRCGAPVVTTNVSCLPEVAGGAALLVDPDDEDGFAQAIESVVDDPALAADLRQRGFANAARFDVDQLRRGTLASYEKAVAGAAASPTDRLRVAMWTPLPPIRSGVADTVEELIGGLRPTCEVETFVDDLLVPAPTLLWQGGVHHRGGWHRRQRLDPFDVAVYQLGASGYHLYLEEAIRSHPGIVVVHDLPWSYVRYSQAAARGQLDDFRRQFARVEGNDAAQALAAIEAEAAAANGPVPDSSATELWNEHSLLGPLLETSLAVIVHSEAAARDLERIVPDVPVHVVPLGVGDAWGTAPDREKARADLGVAGPGLVIGAIGIVHPSKRLESCVRALPALLAEHPDARLVVVGPTLDPAYADGLATLAEHLQVAHAVQLTGHVDRPTFDAWLVACDVVVSLRQPSMRQTSGALMRAAAATNALIVTDTPYTESFPADSCRRIPIGPDEVDRLAAELTNLAGDADARRRMAERARAHFEQNGTIARMAASYLDVIASVTGRAVPPPSAPAGGRILTPAVLALAGNR
ncbi:MAG: hypothetical protein QOG82_737 [Actinomycetota bacterium]|jgi:glycosyltransferase involved in cell wall biosynthesis|nr:hypothetical protein [Actinomycetota bacterium]